MRTARTATLAIVVTSLSCAAPTPSGTVVDVAAKAKPKAADTGGATDATTTSDAAFGSNLPDAPTSAAPTALAVRAATPGQIQCETVDCDLAREICCYDEATHTGRCVPKAGSQGGQPCEAAAQERHCDESPDCGPDAHCCLQFDYDSQCQGTERWICRPGRCDPSGNFSDERCLPGSRCANGACVAREELVGWPRQGHCPPDTPAVACGAVTCKMGEACCWDADAKKGTCATSSDGCQPHDGARHGRSLLWCRGPADCGPGFECFNSTGQALYQEFNCSRSRCHVMSAFLGPRLCNQPADCPKELGVEAALGHSATRTLAGCLPDPRFPPGVKACRYR